MITINEASGTPIRSEWTMRSGVVATEAAGKSPLGTCLLLFSMIDTPAFCVGLHPGPHNPPDLSGSGFHSKTAAWRKPDASFPSFEHKQSRTAFPGILAVLGPWPFRQLTERRFLQGRKYQLVPGEGGCDNLGRGPEELLRRCLSLVEHKFVKYL